MIELAYVSAAGSFGLHSNLRIQLEHCDVRSSTYLSRMESVCSMLSGDPALIKSHQIWPAGEFCGPRFCLQLGLV